MVTQPHPFWHWLVRRLQSALADAQANGHAPADVATGVGQVPSNNTLLLLIFTGRIAPAFTWRDDLIILPGIRPSGDLTAMGFPYGRRARPLWR